MKQLSNTTNHSQFQVELSDLWSKYETCPVLGNPKILGRFNIDLMWTCQLDFLELNTYQMYHEYSLGFAYTNEPCLKDFLGQMFGNEEQKAQGSFAFEIFSKL